MPGGSPSCRIYPAAGMKSVKGGRKNNNFWNNIAMDAFTMCIMTSRWRNILIFFEGLN